MTPQQSVQQVEGLPCRNFRLIADGSLILYVGDLAADGWMSEWCLHIDAAWRLEGMDGLLLGRFDTLSIGDPPDETVCDYYLSRLRPIVGRRIVCIECSGSAADLTLQFDGHLTLRTFTYAIESDSWELRHWGGGRFAFSESAYREWREDPDESRAEAGAPPNGGPGTQVGNSGVTEGPPSVS